MLGWNTNLLATAVFDPDVASVARLAAQLEFAGFAVEASADPDDFLLVVRKGTFRTLVAVGDLADGNSLHFLRRLRRMAPTSWLIVASPKLDEVARKTVRRYGFDVLLAAPIEADELASRLVALQVHSRPLF